MRPQHQSARQSTHHVRSQTIRRHEAIQPPWPCQGTGVRPNLRRKLVSRAFGLRPAPNHADRGFKLLNSKCIGTARHPPASRCNSCNCDLQSSARIDLELFMNNSNHNLLRWAEGFSTAKHNKVKGARRILALVATGSLEVIEPLRTSVHSRAQHVL